MAGRIELACAAEPRPLESPNCWCRAVIGFSLSRLLEKVEGAQKIIISPLADVGQHYYHIIVSARDWLE